MKRKAPVKNQGPAQTRKPLFTEADVTHQPMRWPHLPWVFECDITSRVDFVEETLRGCGSNTVLTDNLIKEGVVSKGKPCCSGQTTAIPFTTKGQALEFVDALDAFVWFQIDMGKMKLVEPKEEKMPQGGAAWVPGVADIQPVKPQITSKPPSNYPRADYGYPYIKPSRGDLAKAVQVLRDLQRVEYCAFSEEQNIAIEILVDYVDSELR
jgi:hypothetical protein